MLTLAQIQALAVNSPVNYTPPGQQGALVATVIQNSQPVDPSSNQPISWMPTVLIIQINGTEMRFNWQLDAWPGGIPELSLAEV
jgi:hypothetical protein